MDGKQTKIYEQIRKAKENFPILERNTEVSYGYTKFKYIDLNSILKAIKKPLSEQQLLLTFTQEICVQGTVHIARIIHTETGESLESRFLLRYQSLEQPQKNSTATKQLTHGQYDQAQGGGNTYGNRIALRNLLSLETEADDSEKIVEKYHKKTEQTEQTIQETKTNMDTIISAANEACELGKISTDEKESAISYCQKQSYSTESVNKMLSSIEKKIHQ